MCHRSSSSCCSQCCAAGIGEQVQHFDRPSCISDLLREPGAVSCLFREQTRMLKTKGLQIECKLLSRRKFIINAPLLRQIKELPLPTTFCASVIMAVFLFPARIFFFRVPDDLRVWSYQKVISPPLQFFSAGRIQHFIIFPSICYPHFIGFLSLLSQNLSCSELYVPMIP